MHIRLQVQLQHKMKQEAEQFRQWKANREKELLQVVCLLYVSWLCFLVLIMLWCLKFGLICVLVSYYSNLVFYFKQLKKEGRRNEYERHKLEALNQRQKMVNWRYKIYHFSCYFVVKVFLPTIFSPMAFSDFLESKLYGKWPCDCDRMRM